jgi:hypothetical protein
MIPPDQTLQARAGPRVAIILTQLDRLIDPPVSITEVGRERRPEMNPETFFRAKDALSFEMLPAPQTWTSMNTYNPIARA